MYRIVHYCTEMFRNVQNDSVLEKKNVGFVRPYSFITHAYFLKVYHKEKVYKDSRKALNALYCFNTHVLFRVTYHKD